MPFFDFLIYKGTQPKHSPRRIVTDEYQIEWHRKGIQFVNCPEGRLRYQENPEICFPISSGTIVSWNQLTDKARYDVTTNSEEKKYVIRMFNRTDVEAFLKGFKEVFNEEINANKELLWYIAECFEEKWNQKPSAKLAKENIRKLKDLPFGIDDIFSELLLKTWQQRLEEQLILDLYSNDEKLVMESIECLKTELLHYRKSEK